MVLSLLTLPFLRSLSALFVGLIGAPGVVFLSSWCIVVAATGILIQTFSDRALRHSPVIITEYSWFDSVRINIDFGLVLHPGSLALLMAVIPVSCGVHFYSRWYLNGDPHVARYIRFISMFTWLMIELAMATSAPALFVGWEGIGLVSYLLIRFWTTRVKAILSAVQAMLFNRIGDMSLMLLLALLGVRFGSADFAFVGFIGTTASLRVVSRACMLALIASMGKSAQLRLHSWLPNAIEAPTPVSALIHAATLVTARVYMLSRLSLLFEVKALGRVILIGALTLLFARLIRTIQTDLKRVIAYSTCSQVAYMTLAMLAGLFEPGITLLVMHAAYKALLFLGAGVVIHAVRGIQDMRLMGGIGYSIPFTALIMLIASAALGAIPYTSRDYSKDLIIEQTLGVTRVVTNWAWMLSVIRARLTLFYTGRLQRLVFDGNPRYSSNMLAIRGELRASTILVVLSIYGSWCMLEGYGFFDYFSTNSGWLDLTSNPLNAVSDVEWSLEGLVSLAPLLASMLGLMGRVNAISVLHSSSIFYWLKMAIVTKFGFDQALNHYVVSNWLLLAGQVYAFGDRRAFERFGPHGISASVLWLIRSSYRFLGVVSLGDLLLTLLSFVALLIFIIW